MTTVTSLLILFSVAVLLIQSWAIKASSNINGMDFLVMGDDQFEDGNYESAGEFYMKALSTGVPNIPNDSILKKYLATFEARHTLEKGFLTLAKRYKQQGNLNLAKAFGEQSLKTRVSAEGAIFMSELYVGGSYQDSKKRLEYLQSAMEVSLHEKDIESMMKIGHIFYELKAHQQALAIFDQIGQLDPSNTEAISAGIYLRANIFFWGKQGKVYNWAMEKLEDIITHEMESKTNTSDVSYQSSIHPHMALGYDIAPSLKLQVARSHAIAEKAAVMQAGVQIVNQSLLFSSFRQEVSKSNFRLKVGYVSANFKSKTTIYMAKDLLRLHNRSRIKLHIYATSPPDSPNFLKVAMKNVDWRKEIENNVEYFHDVSGVNVIDLASMIKKHGIHILLNWDGYSNNGVRATGLFPMQAAPIQIAHQEYIGTMGADYIQYIITDKTVSPVTHDRFYSEKFIWMPHSFLANCFPYQVPHMRYPALYPDLQYLSTMITSSSSSSSDLNSIQSQDQLRLRLFEEAKNKSPQMDVDVNADVDVDAGDPDMRMESQTQSLPFTYCNFNKHLKFSPSILKTWLRILELTQNSYLILLENPAESIPFIQEFVTHYNPDLWSRIRFEKFMNNPYENQFRVSRGCHMVLDTPVYNSHTTAIDALWGGTLLLTLGNDRNMAGRVSQSVLTTLFLPELIAKNKEEYINIAVTLRKNATYYSQLRRRLVGQNLQQSPRNPYWDLERYTSDLEKAFWEIWGRYLRQEVRSHVDVASLTDSVFDARYILTTSPKPSASISSDSNIVKNSNSTMTNKTALKRKSTAIPRKSAAANLENDKSTMLMCQKKCAETCAVTKKYFCSCSCSSPTPNSLL